MKKQAKHISQLIRQYFHKKGELLLIGTVESATGGMISNYITSIPGSSDYFRGSIIAYSNEIKISVVGVQPDTLKIYGAVSPKTAQELAIGGKNLLQVDICISDTGIAGPGGSTNDKPVGLFYLGLAHKDTVLYEQHVFDGSRNKNKQQATTAALEMLEHYLLSLVAN